MAPSTFDPCEVGTGLTLTSGPPPSMLGLLTISGVPTPIGSELAFVLMIDGVSAVGAEKK